LADAAATAIGAGSRGVRVLRVAALRPAREAV